MNLNQDFCPHFFVLLVHHTPVKLLQARPGCGCGVWCERGLATHYSPLCIAKSCSRGHASAGPVGRVSCVVLRGQNYTETFKSRALQTTGGQPASLQSAGTRPSPDIECERRHTSNREIARRGVIVPPRLSSAILKCSTRGGWLCGADFFELFES
jgi:hypothetical protein